MKLEVHQVEETLEVLSVPGAVGYPLGVGEVKLVVHQV